MKTYEKIEAVMRHAGRPIAPHEFNSVVVPDGESASGSASGREFIGCSESALARRLREMRAAGRVTSQYRFGENYKEFLLVAKPAPVPAPEAMTPA